MRAKSPSDAWSLLKSIIESDNSTTACESTRQEFDQLAMIVRESARECITRAKGLATAVRYHSIDVTDEQVGKQILPGLPPYMHFVREGLVLRLGFSVVELEYAIVKRDNSKSDLVRQIVMPWLCFPSPRHGNGGRNGSGYWDGSGGRSVGRHSGGRGKRDGRYRNKPQNLNPPLPYFQYPPAILFLYAATLSTAAAASAL